MESSLRGVSLALVCLLIPVNAMSDEVFLNNGDRLSGKILSKTGGKLILETSYAGKINIQWADVSYLSTEKPVHLTLNDKRELNGILSVTDGAELRISSDVAAEPELLPMHRIVAISQTGAPPFQFTGQVNAGYERDRGNTDEDDYHLDTEMTLRWPHDRLRFSFDVDLEMNDGNRTKQKADLFGKYDHFVTERWFLTTATLLEHDKFADLKLRTTIAAGPGYQFFENDQTNLSVASGPGYVWENFHDSEDQDYPVALWTMQLEHYLSKEWMLQVFHNHTFTQSLETGSDYIFNSKTGVRIPIFDNLQATLQYNFDRDNAPADDTKKNDHEYLLTAGYKW